MAEIQVQSSANERANTFRSFESSTKESPGYKVPTEWTLEKMLSMRATYQHFVPGLLYLAELCLSLPVSNAWQEREASVVKRIKTRMRSRLKNDILGACVDKTWGLAHGLPYWLLYGLRYGLPYFDDFIISQ